MAMRHRPNILLFILLALSGILLTGTSTVTVSAEEGDDPELAKCLDECHSQPHYDIGMIKRCEDKCRKDHPPGTSGDWREGRGSEENRDGEDPKQRLTECRLSCLQQYRDHGQQMRCQKKCEEKYKHERRGNPRGRYEEQERERGENPYVFSMERFRYEIRNERGYVTVLDRLPEKLKLLLGLANYSVSLLVASPRTFVTPVHFDADCTCYVIQGHGTVTTLREGATKSHEIRRGDVFVTQAGSVLYLVSSDRHQKLVLAKFLRSTSLTGKVTHFYAAGGENPKSVYRSFSDEILEAAFNVPQDRIKRIFSRQSDGAFVEASDEQIQALSQHSTGGESWPFGESVGPFNLLHKEPTHSNRYGELREADSDDYRKLGHLNLRVSLSNINKGSMMAPFYNSRSTKFAVVTEGNGYIEILCPHVARRGQRAGSQARRYRQHEHEQGERWQERGGSRYREEAAEEEEGYHEEEAWQGPRYQRVRARVSLGTVFIVPPGHPVVEIASRDQNLQTICFEIRADGNERSFLAGRNNVLRKLEREAKELAFATSAREVDAVFEAQKEEAFLPGPWARRQRRSWGEGEEWGSGGEPEDASAPELVAAF